jgi:membrane-bound lytic murein transglycosylase D
VGIAVSLLLLFLSGCGSIRKPSGTTVVVVNPPSAAEKPDPEIVEAEAVAADPIAAEPEETLPDPVGQMIEQANLEFDLGRELFEESRVAEAHSAFQSALDGLRAPEYPFADNPRLEREYHALLADLQTIEVQSLVDPADLQTHPIEPSPLDEIGDLNLFAVEVDPSLKEAVSEDLRQVKLSFPLVLNEVVLRFLNYYMESRRSSIEEGLKRRGKYLPMLKRIFEEEEVPVDLVYMAQVESLFKPHAYSRARAVGVWQFMAGTGRRYGLEIDWWIDERSDVQKSTRAAARHLNDLYERYHDWPLVLAAYNAGPGRIDRNLRKYGDIDYWTMVKRRLLPRETRNQVPSILAAILIHRNPEMYGFRVESDPFLRHDGVPIDFQVDLHVVAEELGIEVTQLRELNPELRRDMTPFERPDYQLKVPEGLGTLAADKLAALPAEKRLRWAHHKVRNGETLSQISGKYRTSIRAIAEVNHIRNINRLRLGQDLIIPLSGVAPSSAATYRGQRPSRYTVRSGDSLYRIARRYGITVKDLTHWNNLEPDATIYPGQRLRLKN